ncbi:ras-related and estrogen-regulated growth inhibitor-like protein [Hydractinia symbiolongicarpus]|uniref:ras-related and estrogen-regulated growth inhibitor-like protein n=1 Tax=Hydractinia symbiolongicarpus TaxID=13093 RepID=UPI00254BA2B7|nr:ras-related and estrogen-regulated growth inhibitor-like protein [Hydractinia symbiolongicarpus]
MRDLKEQDIRLALAGAKNCGKSALAVRFLTRRFIGEYDSHKDTTITRSIEIADRAINLHLRDTTGTDWMKSATNVVNWSSALIIVYSITDRGSFLVANHILEIIHKLKPLNSGCTLLLGNKNDLKHLRQVEKKEAKRLALDFGVRFIECSASESYDEIHSSFTRLILEALLVQNAKRLSFESSEDEKSKPAKEVVRTRRRSSSQPQPHYVPSCNKSPVIEEKKDTFHPFKSMDLIRTPSPAERRREQLRDMPRQARKQSLRRKISGIGSRIVGSQNTR